MNASERKIASWLAEEMLRHRARLDDSCHAEGCEMDDADPPCPGCLDVRLRLHDGDAWCHVGGASYDTDHRGNIGAGSIRKDTSPGDVLREAESIVSQAVDMMADDPEIPDVDAALAEITDGL